MVDNITLLFIRACKSKNPEKRIHSVYRRFYGKYDLPQSNIAYILSTICDKYLNISNTQMIEKLNPSNTWMYENSDGTEPDYYTIVMKVLCSTIRLSEVKCFPGMIKPAMFRNVK